jgi:hypothetical protein
MRQALFQIEHDLTQMEFGWKTEIKLGAIPESHVEDPTNKSGLSGPLTVLLHQACWRTRAIDEQ